MNLDLLPSVDSSQLVQGHTSRSSIAGIQMLGPSHRAAPSVPQQPLLRPGVQGLAHHQTVATSTISPLQPPGTLTQGVSLAFSTSLPFAPYPSIQTQIDSHLAAPSVPFPGSLLPGQTHLFNSARGMQAQLPSGPLQGFTHPVVTTNGERFPTRPVALACSPQVTILGLTGAQRIAPLVPARPNSSDHDALEALFNLPWSSTAPYTIARPVAHLTEEDLLLKRWVESTMPSFSEATQAQRASTVCDMDFGRNGRRMSFSYSQHGRLSNDANKRRQVQTMDLTMLSGWRDLPPAPVCNNLLISTGTVCPAQMPPFPLASTYGFDTVAQQLRNPITAAHEAEAVQLLGSAPLPLSSNSLAWQESCGMFLRKSDAGPQSTEGSFLLQTWPSPVVPQNFSAHRDAGSLEVPSKLELVDIQVSSRHATHL